MFLERTQRLLTLLTSEAESYELLEQKGLVAKIEQYRQSLLERASLVTAESLQHLTAMRASVSRSLQKSQDAIQRWNEAQALLYHWLTINREVDINALINLNTVLSGLYKPGWREVDIYTVLVKHVNVQEIEPLMQVFIEHLNTTLVNKGGLYAAFICRYWILSIHPFADANGRTSQLSADYLLLKHGYLPQAFSSSLEALMIGDPEKKSYMNPHRAFKRFAHTIFNAYELVTAYADRLFPLTFDFRV